MTWESFLNQELAPDMIRKAEPQEHRIITDISFASKRHWNYPQEYFDIWHEELTISAGYISNNTVFVYEQDTEIFGYYSLVALHLPIQTGEIRIPAGLWLDHMFLQPQFIGKGIGRQLFGHAIETARQSGHGLLRILADPNSAGFYSKMGSIHVCEYPSTIPGRTTPYFEHPLQ